METWKKIPGFSGAYEVSDLGNVRALDRVTDRGRRWKGKTLTPVAMENGYLIVTLWRDGKQKSHLVHRLVLSAFVGIPAPGYEALHRDGDRANNAVSNLEWGNHSQNQYDQVRHGTHGNASKDQCPQGHPYDEQNTYWYPGKPHRACRTCRRDHAHKTALNRKAA